MTVPMIDFRALIKPRVRLEAGQDIEVERIFAPSPDEVRYRARIINAAGDAIDSQSISCSVHTSGEFKIVDLRVGSAPAFVGNLAALQRQIEIEDELRSYGCRMQHSLSALDGEGHAVVSIPLDELLDDSGLSPRVIELASEWSRLEGVEDEQGGNAAPAATKQLSSQQLLQALQKLADQGLTFSDCLQIFGVNRDEDPHARAAQANNGREGELEFDDRLVVSRGDDPGAYVLGWCWVYDSETWPMKGDEVWWEDPDDSACSGLFVVTEAESAEQIVLQNAAGSIAEATSEEVVKIDRDEVGEWVGQHYKVNFDAEPDDRRVEWIGRWAKAQLEAKLAEDA